MRYDDKCILVFMYNIPYSCQILMKLEFYQQSFEKYSNIKFHENPSSGNRVVACGYMERQTMQLMVVFQNFSKALKRNMFMCMSLQLMILTLKFMASLHLINIQIQH